MSGLLHKIGEIPIYTYAAKYIIEAEELELIPNLATKMGPSIGIKIINYWNLNQQYSQVIEHCTNLCKVSLRDAEYADIIIAAKVHYLIHHKYLKQLPPMKDIAALNKIQIGKITPQLSIEILLEAEEQIRALNNI